MSKEEEFKEAFKEKHGLDMDLVIELREQDFPKDEPIVVPSLRELIEYFGESFSELKYDYFEDKIWKAYAYPADRMFKRNTKRVVGSGSTPKEAVARLWLALNKK